MPRRKIDPMSNFELALIGYNRKQVDRHLDQLNQRLADAMEVYDAATALQSELHAARAEVESMRQVAADWPGNARLGEQVTEILMIAEEQAAAIRAEAEQDAERIRASARRGDGTPGPDGANSRTPSRDRAVPAYQAGLSAIEE